MVGDIADVKHALAVRLQSEAFATALAAVDDEKADGIETPLPTQIFEGEKVNLSDVGYPVGEVIAVKTVYDQGSGSKRSVHEVHLFWTQVGDDELTITQHIERLVRATRDLFWPPNDERVSLPEVHGAPIVFVSEDYTALAPKVNKTGFVKGSWTVLLVTTETV